MTTIEETCAALSAVGRAAVERGLVQASGGNLSAKIDDDHFVVTGAGTWLDRLEVKDFAVLDLGGNVIDGNIKPSSEWKLHQRTYQVREDVKSIVHIHPQYAVLLDALGRDIRFITLDHAYYVGSVGSTPYYPNGSDELADTAAEQAKAHNCVILGHHGCSAVGDTIEMAYRRALNLEEAATATFRALLLGDTTTSFPEEWREALHHA